MDPNSTNPDPFGQAMSGAGQKIAELAAVAALAGQVVAQVRARKAMQGAQDDAAQQAGLAEARTKWAPVLDAGWRADAGLLDVARAWGAALPYEADDAGARDALDAAEERMRQLHPYAMARYDARRGNGMSRGDAMMATAPDFALHPSPRPAPADVRVDRDQAALPPAPGLTEADAHVLRDVLPEIARLSQRSAAAGHGPLNPDVAEAALSGLPGVSPVLSARVADGLRSGAISVPSPGPAVPTVADAGPGAVSWPHGVHEAVAASALRRAGGRRPSGARRGKAAKPPVRRPSAGL